MTSGPSDRANPAREHQIFWMLVKGSRDHPVGRVYLAIQAALAFRCERVDVGWLAGAMMATGRRAMDGSGEPIGADGLAYFHWLYEVELAAAGEADCHQYRIRRRHDGSEILASLQTAVDPRSLHFAQVYERAKRKLTAKRAAFLAAFNPTVNP